MGIWIVTAIIIAALILLITELIPVDFTALGIIVVLLITGILTPAEGVAGFANPAVITVGAMFLISSALIRTGAVGFLARLVVDFSRGKARLALLIVLLIVAAASAFINNTPVVVLFIPIIMHLSCEYGLSPSKYLIPVSYASILAGTCTLIGTSTNIIVSDLSHMYGYGSIGMFELSILGVPVALVGIVFLFVLAPRVMPASVVPTCEIDKDENRRYLAEFTIPAGSPLIGKNSNSLFIGEHPTVQIFEVIRGDRIFYPDQVTIPVAANDLLLLKGSATDLVSILQENAVRLPHDLNNMNFSTRNQDSFIVELIIPPQSSLIGERLLNTGLFNNPDVNVIAVKRRRMHYSAQKIRNLKLRVGDIMLVRCPKSIIERIRTQSDAIVVEDVHYEIVHKRKARLALVIFAGVVAAAAGGLAEIMVCALCGVFLMFLSGCLHLRDAYQALRGEVLLLIAGTIAIGAAMEKTGATTVYTQAFLSLFHGASPAVVLAGFLFLTCLSTQILSNNATAVLLLPVAVSTAEALGVNPRTFIVAICFGASACFASPFGYQTNLLVYGPGNYRFSDYLILGIPLNLLILLMGSLFIPRFWPFGT